VKSERTGHIMKNISRILMLAAVLSVGHSFIASS
jgi:hypothetical protein